MSSVRIELRKARQQVTALRAMLLRVLKGYAAVPWTKEQMKMHEEAMSLLGMNRFGELTKKEEE